MARDYRKAVERRSKLSVENVHTETAPDLYDLRLLLNDGINSGEPVDGEAALREIAERYGLQFPADVDGQ